MKYGIMFLTLILTVSCAGKDINPDQMSPKQIAVWAHHNYVAQYKAYIQDFEYGSDNAVMKEALKKKKKLLDRSYTALNVYNSVLLDDQVPGPALTNELVRLIYELTGVY